MTEQKNKKPSIEYNKKYNKKRIPILRVEGTKADLEEVECLLEMKEDLILQSGEAKKGVLDMYEFCKKNGFFGK